MKTNKKVQYSLLLAMSILLLSSCSNIMSIEKRKYRNGFYIEHTAKPSSEKINSFPAAIEKNDAASSQVADQRKDDSVPVENSYEKKNASQKRIDSPVKNKSKTPPVKVKKKRVKVIPSIPRYLKKQVAIRKVAAKKSQPDDGEGVVIFFVVAASFVLALLLAGFAVLYLVLAGMATLIVPVLLGIVVLLVLIDFLIIRAINR